jgi:hypothetical protein
VWSYAQGRAPYKGGFVLSADSHQYVSNLCSKVRAATDLYVDMTAWLIALLRHLLSMHQEACVDLAGINSICGAGFFR